jgi:hypothetical protein
MPVTPFNSEKEPSPLMLNTFHHIDAWRTQLVPLLKAAGQEVTAFQTPSPCSKPYYVSGQDNTQVNTPTTTTKDSYQSDQSLSTSYPSKESQLSHQDPHFSYPSLISSHASVTLDTRHSQTTQGHVAQPYQFSVYTPTELNASATKGKAPADNGACGL